MLGTIYNEIIYRPLLNLLVFFYNVIPGHDIGVVIILLTILIRIALAPSFHKSLKSQAAMSALQPKLNELREKHKDDKEGQARAMMQLYKEHKINPLSSCLPLLVQLPLLIALYQVFDKALKSKLEGLYGFVSNPGTVNLDFLGLINLAHSSLIIAFVAAAAQFWQSKMMIPKTPSTNQDFSASMSKNMLYLMPIMTLFLAWQFKIPNGLLLYWIATTLFSIAQQYYIMRKQPVP